MLANQNIANVGQDSPVYTVPAGKRSTCSLSLCNRSATPQVVNVAICQNGQTPNADGSNYVEFNLSIPAYTSYERAGLVLLSGQILFVRNTTSGNNLTAVVYGIEE